MKDRNPYGIKTNEVGPTIAPAHYTSRATAQKTQSVHRADHGDKKLVQKEKSRDFSEVSV